MTKINTSLVFRDLSTEEWSELLSNSANVVVYEDYTCAPANVKIRRCRLDSVLKKEVNAKVLKELISFASVEIDGTPLMEKLKFEGAYLWYYHRFRVYYSVREGYQIIEAVKKHLKTNDFLTVYSDDNIVQRFFMGNNSVDVISSSIIGTRSKISRLALLSFGIRFSFRGIQSRFRIGKVRKRKNLLIVNNDLSVQQKKSNLSYNPYYADLLSKGDSKDWAILRFNPFPKLDKGISNWKKEEPIDSDYPQFNSECVLFFHGIKNFRQIKKINQFLNELSEGKSKIEEALSPIHKSFYSELIHLKSSSKLYLFQYICFRSFFEKMRFNTVSTISEHSSNERSILDAARMNKVHTIGIQHGLIAQMNVSYIYGESESKYSPIPDHTIIWGENSRQILTEYSCYTMNNTEVLGQLRTDVIYKMSGSRIVRKIPGGKDNAPVVVYTTQPQKDEAVRTQAALAVIELAREFPNVQIVFKLHPAESKSYYKKLLRETDEVLLFTQEMDLYHLLEIQSVHITCFSTVGAESIYFGTPLITIDPLDEDIAHYKENGVAIQVKNAEELIAAFDNLMQNSFESTLDTAAFIQQNSHKIDGKVADRYIQHINSLN